MKLVLMLTALLLVINVEHSKGDEHGLSQDSTDLSKDTFDIVAAIDSDDSIESLVQPVKRFILTGRKLKLFPIVRKIFGGIKKLFSKIIGTIKKLVNKLLRLTPQPQPQPQYKNPVRNYHYDPNMNYNYQPVRNYNDDQNQYY